MKSDDTSQVIDNGKSDENYLKSRDSISLEDLAQWLVRDSNCKIRHPPAKEEIYIREKERKPAVQISNFTRNHKIERNLKIDVSNPELPEFMIDFLEKYKEHAKEGENSKVWRDLLYQQRNMYDRYHYMRKPYETNKQYDKRTAEWEAQSPKEKDTEYEAEVAKYDKETKKLFKKYGDSLPSHLKWRPYPYEKILLFKFSLIFTILLLFYNPIVLFLLFDNFST
uniref:Uncharacterized protein n=1 Tax=Strongyloides papillosus TaxID=174720 RepID=A0A0N5CAR6_STREA